MPLSDPDTQLGTEVPVIQTHGALLLIERSSEIVVSVSENLGKFFHLSAVQIFGNKIENLLGTRRMDYIRVMAKQAGGLQKLPPFLIGMDKNARTSQLLVATKEFGPDHVMVECQLPDFGPQMPQSSYLHHIANAGRTFEQMAMHSSLFGVLAAEVAGVLDFDRICLLRFDQAGNAEVLADRKKDALPSLLNSWFHAEDLRPLLPYLHYGRPVTTLSMKASCRMRIGSLLYHPLPVPPDWWRYSSLAALPVEVLRYFMGLNADSLAIFPVFRGEVLWGILLCLNRFPKPIAPETAVTTDLLVRMFMSRLMAIEETETKRYTLEKAKELGQIETFITQQHAFLEHFPLWANQLMQLVEAAGACILTEGRLYTIGEIPTKERIDELFHFLSEQMTENGMYITDHLPLDFPAFASSGRQASGLIAASIPGKSRGFVLWFRPEVVRSMKWIGAPNQQDRKMLSTWHQSVRNHAIAWKKADIRHAAELRNVMTSALLRLIEEEAAQSERFRLMFRHSSDLVSILDQHLDVRYVSHSAEGIMGYTQQEWKEQWQDLIHIDDWPPLHQALRGKDGIIGKRAEFRARHKRGHWVYLETIISDLTTHPDIKGILLNSTDITTRVESRQHLMKFMRAVDSSPSGVLILEADDAMTVSYANAGYEKIMGYTTEETVGRPCIFFQDDSVNSHETQLLRQAAYNHANCEVLVMTHRKDGGLFRNQLNLAPVHDQSGKLINYVLLLADVTHEKLTEEKLHEYTRKLKASVEELQTFAYVASHDLQEPLRTISGFSELLAELLKGKLEAEAEEYLTFILQATVRMKTLIQDLLQFSRVSTGKEYIGEVEVGKILVNCMNNLHSAVERSQAVVTFRHMPVVIFNETLLMQVFQNLISNAIKYQKENTPPQVHINAEELPTEWQFSVADNGIGIDRRYFDRIFVIFQRLHTNEKYSGTGMGLAICKKIVEKYGGRIWVQSAADEGSTFYFTIPKQLNLS